MRFEAVNLNPGAIVRLKSGGPPMVVRRTCADMMSVVCSWEDERRVVRLVRYNVLMLTQFTSLEDSCE